MPTIDKRLLPLIETLVATDADWIAFEMVEALRAGRVAEETEADLNAVQGSVRSKAHAKQWVDEAKSPPAPAGPISGVEQIDWAVGYIDKRLSDVLEMLDATFNQLDAILYAGAPAEARKQTPDSQTNEVTLVLKDDREWHANVRRDQAASSKTMLPQLRDALLKWADSVRASGDAE